MIAKLLISGVIALAAAVTVAAPATADPSTTTTCSCRPPAQGANTPAPSSEQLDQGLRHALSDMQAAHQ